MEKTVSNIKEHFISRWGGEGYIVELDYSQLEIIVLAHLSQDKQLIEDITSGVDLHTVRAADMYNIPEHKVTKQQRKRAKSFSFQLQYGSGAKKMAEQVGATEQEAQAFISAYYARYPEVKKMQDSWVEEVKMNRVVSAEKTAGGYPVGTSFYTSQTGRIYTFRETDSPEWMQKRGMHTSFKPTMIKNYRVQGMATGDIVPMMVGVLVRWLYENDLDETVKFVNTVHDSIVLDIHETQLYTVAHGAKKLLESAPALLKTNFNINFTLPLKVEVSYGRNWHDQEPFNF